MQFYRFRRSAVFGGFAALCIVVAGNDSMRGSNGDGKDRSLAVRQRIAFLPPPAAARTPAPSIDFEIVLEGGLAPTAAQEWIELFKGIDQSSVRIRNARGDDRPNIERQPLGNRTSYRVTGVVRANNMLLLPGGTFRVNDRAKLRQWIEKLQEGGDESITEKPGAFGLLAKQLIEVHEKLAVKIPFSTRGKSPREVGSLISRLISVEIVIEARAKEALQDTTPLEDELEGLAAGTALAAAMRPAGLVLVPEKPRGDAPRIRIVDVRDAEQSWPIGWPLNRPTTDTVPKLLEFLEVEIENTPLSDALPAIQERLGVPFLYDRNGLARAKVNLEETLVSLPGKRTYYAKLLDRVLAKPNLKWEVRKDELEQSFIWISPKR
ncbi:MAG: hypothetical protein FJ295_02300 [Planctomycetes bacterium]|nr:hypothetical protein [Planctomycetota bacterium]